MPTLFKVATLRILDPIYLSWLIFYSTLYNIIIMIIFYASLTESKLYIDRNFCLFCSLLDSQDLEQWQ